MSHGIIPLLRFLCWLLKSFGLSLTDQLLNCCVTFAEFASVAFLNNAIVFKSNIILFFLSLLRALLFFDSIYHILAFLWVLVFNTLSLDFKL